MDDVILERISRIYAAIGAIEETDPHKLKATVIRTDTIKGVFQDFRGGFSDDELCNQAHTVIHNIANLRDHLRRWAAHNSHDKSKVDQAVDNSLDLQMITDLSNNDKHGYPPRDGGCSGRSPKLTAVCRVMRLETQPQQGSMIAVTIGAGGVPRFVGDGTAKAVVTGDVVDRDDNRIGDLYEIAQRAVLGWEVVLLTFGLMAITNGT
jgi:hypothetical protein